MLTIDERQAVEQVSERLAARFPDVPAAVVRSTVRDEHSKLQGPVRAYVPVLVERAARERLSVITPIGDAQILTN